MASPLAPSPTPQSLKTKDSGSGPPGLLPALCLPVTTFQRQALTVQLEAPPRCPQPCYTSAQAEGNSHRGVLTQNLACFPSKQPGSPLSCLTCFPLATKVQSLILRKCSDSLSCPMEPLLANRYYCVSG